MARIAFIGLGNMGLPMAQNLVKAGHEVCGVDVVAENMTALADSGGIAAKSLAEAVTGSDVIITMLPAGQHVRQVCLDDDGVLAHAAGGALIIDCSTIDVATARDVAAKADAAGIAMIDAPVSGGIMGAQGATLTFMCGGSDDAFSRAEPILQNMGKNIIHAGGPGNGQAAKICNNMLLGISMIGTCEAFVLAEKLGLDHQKLFDISSTASGQCWSLTTYCPVPGPVPASPANRDYVPGFSVAMMLKDLLLAQNASESSSAHTPLGRHAAEIYEFFDEAGNGSVDFSGIINHLRKKSGT